MLSIIIPTYNSSKTIGPLLDSIIQTKFDSYEILIVDDKSTDNTVEICRKYNKCRIIEMETNSGPAKARNIGACNANGDIIIFMDSDILLLPHIDLILEIHKVFESDPTIDMISTISDIHPIEPNSISYNNSVYQMYYLDKLLKDKQSLKSRANFFSTRLGGIRKNRFIESGGFYESLNTVMNEDGEFWSRCYNINYIGYINRDFLHSHHYPVNMKHFIKSYFLSAMIQYFIDKKWGTDIDTGNSSIEKVRRIFALLIIFSPFSILFITFETYLLAMVFLLSVFLVFFGKMNTFVMKNVPGKYILKWYLVYIFISPFIISGYLYGILRYFTGTRFFNNKPSDLECFSASQDL